MRDHDRALRDLTALEAAELLGLFGIERRLTAVTVATGNLHRTVHELKEIIVTTKDEILGDLADARGFADETQKDVRRLIDRFGGVSAQLKDVAARLDQAIADGDLSAVSTSVTELRRIGQATDEAVEAVSPEPDIEPTPEPTLL